MTWGQAFRRFGPIAVVALLAAAVFATGLWRHISIDELQRNRMALTAYVAVHPFNSLAAYLAVFILIASACAPGPGVLAVAGGFLFGTLIGGAAALISCTVGAAVVFTACRTAFGDWAQHRAGPTIRRVEAEFSERPFQHLVVLRLIPVLPLSVVNIAAGLARIRLSTLVGATLIGSAPCNFLFASVGAAIGRLSSTSEPLSLRSIASIQVLAPLFGLSLLATAPIFWRLWRGRGGQT